MQRKSGRRVAWEDESELDNKSRNKNDVNKSMVDEDKRRLELEREREEMKLKRIEMVKMREKRTEFG